MITALEASALSREWYGVEVNNLLGRVDTAIRIRAEKGSRVAVVNVFGVTESLIQRAVEILKGMDYLVITKKASPYDIKAGKNWYHLEVSW